MVMVTLATTSAYRTRSSCPGCPGLGTVTASSRTGFLPALTLAACRSKIIVTAAVSVESHSHLFVFHLVVHLCISMVSARGCTEKRATLKKKKEKKEKARSLPQSNKKKKKMYLYYSAMCVSIRMPFTARLGPSDPLHLKPSSQTDGKGALMKKKKKKKKQKEKERQQAQGTLLPRELRTVRRLDQRRNTEPEPTLKYWHWKILRSSNHQPGKLSRDPPPELWKRSEQHQAEHHCTPVQPNDRAHRGLPEWY